MSLDGSFLLRRWVSIRFSTSSVRSTYSRFSLGFTTCHSRDGSALGSSATDLDGFELRQNLLLVTYDDTSDVEILIPAQPELPTIELRFGIEEHTFSALLVGASLVARDLNLDIPPRSLSGRGGVAWNGVPGPRRLRRGLVASVGYSWSPPDQLRGSTREKTSMQRSRNLA